jgi:glycosyltransferase involved in cell wall biosynthesis
VGIDALQLVFGVSGGVETYADMLVSALLDAGNRVTLICNARQLPVLRERHGDRAGYFVIGAGPAARLAVKAWNLVRPARERLPADRALLTFSRLAEDLGIEVLHSPVQLFSKLDFRVPAVLNLHDLQHLHHPENFSAEELDTRQQLWARSAALADAVIVSSDFVHRDLVARMGLPASKIHTVPISWNPAVEAGLRSFTVEAARRHYGLPARYAYYPAQFWPHKNHVRLLQALRDVREHRPGTDLKLVLTGYRGHAGWPQVERTIASLGLASDVLCLDHVPVQHVAALYQASLFCVIPSTFEGSSQPVIEAQMLGVPVMCSDLPSISELVADGTGLLFDPLDSGDIAAKMMRWVDDADDRRERSERASVRVRRERSLDGYARRILDVYRSVAIQ